MIEKQSWMNTWIYKLHCHFEERLLFCGLQGSYRRDEATESSDFDVVTILDVLAPKDLDFYRDALQEMPECHKACGFIAGRKEIERWPRSEVFQFYMDTEPYFGDLKPYIPQITTVDIYAGLRGQVSALYHMVCHLRLYGNFSAQKDELRAAYKAVFFALQLMEYLRSGTYILSRHLLILKLTGLEAELLQGNMYFDIKWEKLGFDVMSAQLISWCSEALCTLPE